MSNDSFNTNIAIENGLLAVDLPTKHGDSQKKYKKISEELWPFSRELTFLAADFD